jgi:uncharacterized protein
MGDNGSDGIPTREPIKQPNTKGQRYIEKTAPKTAKVWIELVLFWFVIMLGVRGFVLLQSSSGLPEWILGIVPFLFIYSPVWLCHFRGVSSWDYHLSIPAFRDWPAWWSAMRSNLKVNLCIWPWFIPVYHFYQTEFFSQKLGWVFPEELLLIIAYQFFFVAIPEEFFYRGYFQTRLNEIFPKKFLIFGVPMGWGAIWASLFFAFGHSLVQFQWWHFATFFPGLIFAWMKEKNNGIISGA